MPTKHKHTPGPWIARCDRHSASNRMALVITTASSASKRVQAIDCTGSAESYGGDCANARLIAAAPELLAACEAAMADGLLAGETLNKIATAIVNATGEQS